MILVGQQYWLAASVNPTAFGHYGWIYSTVAFGYNQFRPGPTDGWFGVFAEQATFDVTITANPVTATPEPATLALFSSGVLVFGVAVRRRRSSHSTRAETAEVR